MNLPPEDNLRKRTKALLPKGPLFGGSTACRSLLWHQDFGSGGEIGQNVGGAKPPAPRAACACQYISLCLEAYSRTRNTVKLHDCDVCMCVSVCLFQLDLIHFLGAL